MAGYVHHLHSFHDIYLLLFDHLVEYKSTTVSAHQWYEGPHHDVPCEEINDVVVGRIREHPLN